MNDKTGSIETYEIFKYTHKTLQESTLNLTEVDDSVHTAVKGMFNAMYKEKAIGLAANQVGMMVSIIVVDVDWVKPSRNYNPMVLINPKVSYGLGKSAAFEGCLSVPQSMWLTVPRYASVGVDYLDLELKPQHIDADRMLARCLQHEIDHLNGKTILDHSDKTITVDCCFSCKAYRTTLFNVCGPDGKKVKACALHKGEYQKWRQ